MRKCVFALCRYVCVCVDTTYPALKQQAPASGVAHSLLIPLHQLSSTEQADS